MRAGISVRFGPFWISSGGGTPRPPKPPREKPGPVAWTFVVLGSLGLLAGLATFIWGTVGDFYRHDAIALAIVFGVPALVLLIVLPWRRIARRVFVKD